MGKVVFTNLSDQKTKPKAFIGTEGAFRLPTTYDNHPSNPIQSSPSIQASTYSSEDDLSIEDLI